LEDDDIDSVNFKTEKGFKVRDDEYFSYCSYQNQPGINHEKLLKSKKISKQKLVLAEIMKKGDEQQIRKLAKKATQPFEEIIDDQQ